MASDVLGVEKLSLCGLFSRLEEVERYKEVVRPSEEQQAVLSSETAAKKAVLERMTTLSASGLTSREKSRAKEFLQAQLKSVDTAVAGSEKRLAKLKELLGGVEFAPSVEEGPHVRQAKQELQRTQKAYDEVHKSYEKWEKGKQMLNVDELKVLKRSHEDAEKRLEAAKALVETQITRLADSAAEVPSVLRSAASSASASRPKGPAVAAPTTRVVRGGGPAARASGAAGRGGGYPGSAPSGMMMRQAQVAAELRQQDYEAEEPPPPPPPRQPRPAPQKTRVQEELPGPVLSYACTVIAVAERLQTSQDQARAMAESSREFAEVLDEESWAWVKERSVAIEKQQREEKREAEKRKQERALARATDKMGPPPPAATGAPTTRSPASAPGVAKAKPKQAAVPKQAGPRRSATDGIKVHQNRFGGLSDDEDSDDGGADGWSKVKGR